MKASELRELTAEEMAKKVDDLKAELFNLRFKLATGELDNPTRIRAVRRDIARALTVRRERELAGEDMTARGRLVGAKEAARRGRARRAARTARSTGDTAGAAAEAPRGRPARRAPRRRQGEGGGEDA